MFTYCGNNPVIYKDTTGMRHEISAGGGGAFTNPYPTVSLWKIVAQRVNDVAEDFKNYDSNNQSEDVVFSANYFSNYKGALVINTSFDASFSYGVIGLSRNDKDSDSLNHEYGHFLQMKEKGIVKYTTDVAIPSITINILDRKGKLPYDYYSYPWEAEANKLGGATLFERGKPKLPQGGYSSYWDLIQLFFE